MSEGKSFTGQTVEAARRGLATQFRQQSVDSADLDARLLAGAALGLDLTGLIAAAGRTVTQDEATCLKKFLQQRLAGEPVARILGVKEFWGLEFELSPATLVPRPDTETVVELALEIWRDGCESHLQPSIIDIGTGSGAILLALLSELPQATGIGTDISLMALQTANRNATRFGLAPRTAFVACDYAAALSGMFDLIVSNPPYIRSADIAGLDREVREYDPPGALDGGVDGLDAYRWIAPEAARLLAPGGALVVEVGQGQSSDVQGLMAAAGLRLEGAPKADLAGIRRVAAFRKRPR